MVGPVPRVTMVEPVPRVTMVETALEALFTNKKLIIKNQYFMTLLTMHPAINSVIFSMVGFGILLLCYFIIEKITPENTWKEIVQNKNVALAIVFASFIIGISMIISASVHG